MPLIIGAIILVLAGVGLALTINNVYEVVDVGGFGGTLPGGSPGDASGGGGIGLFSSIGVLVVLGGFVLLFLAFRK